MNTTKAIIILIVFITGLILGYQRFVVNAPEQEIENENQNIVTSPQVLSLLVGDTGEFGNLQITLNQVTQDSRCFVDAECIESGAVNTNLTLKVGEVSQDIFYSSDSVPFSFGDYNISIIAINPPLTSGATIDQSQYQIDFYVASEMQQVVGVPIQETPSQKEISPLGYACLNAGGEWSQEFSECLGLSGESCSQIGGNWNDCASACRNNPEAEVCTLQCVQVCEI